MDVCLYTNIGTRDVNEDSIDKNIISDSKGFFVIADGLGGHGKGEVASKLVTDAMKEKSKIIDIATENFLQNSILYAQNSLIEAQEKLNVINEMKTTVVCLRIFDGKAQWGHVGDSRLYMWRKGKLYIRTYDHSVPQMLVVSGEIKEKQIRFHEDRNRLIRVLGTKWENPKYDISEIYDIQSGDAFFMCTDGFWELINEREMRKCLKKSLTAQEWISRMAEIVNKKGLNTDMDNNTALAVIV